jgi:hypothetical protein
VPEYLFVLESISSPAGLRQHLHRNTIPSSLQKLLLEAAQIARSPTGSSGRPICYRFVTTELFRSFNLLEEV